MKTAIIFDIFGPYHWSRTSAAAKLLSSVTAIEVFSRNKEYPWFASERAGQIDYQQVLPGAERHSYSRKELIAGIRRALDLASPDVVVVPGWSDHWSLAALEWCKNNRVPSVIMSESTAWDEPRKPWKEFIKRRIVGLGTAALVGGSPHREYLAQLGMPAERVFLGYNAVDNSYFADKVAEVRNQLPAPRFFLASARFVEKKNLPRLIEAYARYRILAQKSETGNPLPAPCSDLPSQVSGLRSQVSAPWSLVLLGDGELRPAICSQLQALGLQSSVLLAGAKPYAELPAYYANAGAFIHASTTEQWGLVVNEAMASGLPVLVSNRCGCAQDLVQEGVNGFTFDPYNVEQLAQLMVQVSGFKFQVSEFGAASARIISNWGPERFAQGLAAAVEKAVACGPVKPTLLQRMILKALLWK
ncbi:MAG: glycosyltransferase family 4 protein [Verrucomicrobiota bacterium]